MPAPALAISLVVAAWGVAGGALLPLHAERLRAEVGGFAVMNCRLDFPFGHEIPYRLEWHKDGESIFSWYSGEPEARVTDRWGGRVQRVGVEGGAAGGEAVLGGGSINVSSVRETDAGLYHCRVSFPNRSPPARNNGTFFYLDVDGGNLIVTPPRNATVLEGERAELECLPQSGAWDVHWYRDGAELRALPALQARADRPSNGSLVLRSATAADAGEYLCRVRAPDGRTQSAAAYLDVHYKAKVVYAPRERHLPFGKPASLDCHFSANPPLTNLRWEKDGFLFDPYNVPGVFYSRNGSLLFNQVDESHEGVYSCAPYNALGTAGASGGVRVRVLHPPTLVVRPHPLYLTRLGATVALPCVALSEAPHDHLAVHWTRKDGSDLPVGRHSLDGGNLTIVEVREEDRGTYECTASNEAAAVSVETDLVLENMPPRAPFGLVAHPESQSLHLSWAPGHSGEEAEYQVWYRERGAGEWRSLRLLSLGVTRATVGGLRPDTEYELRVLAQDQLGDGLFSKPLFVHTLAEDEEKAAAASVTEWSNGSEGGENELEVSVRTVEKGALVRWERAPLDESRCTMRWYSGEPPHVTLLGTYTTHHDHMLVRRVEEGGRYWARVECGAGAGGAVLSVSRAGQIHAALAACAGSALLLAVLAFSLYLARRRLRAAKRNH